MDLPGYYAARAPEYEAVYAKPERQADLAILREVIAEYFRDRRVLEIACGTAFWTAVYARRARGVTATDIGEEVLEIARTKPLGPHVRLTIADAYALSSLDGAFDAGFVGFWWSHVPLRRLHAFLVGLHGRLGAGARVLIVDNRYVHGSNWPVTREDVDGTYQRRRLADGSEHDVLKNFPTSDEVRLALAAAGSREIEITSLEYYWYATYVILPSLGSSG
jgi:SAM-dependent methyltransferase